MGMWPKRKSLTFLSTMEQHCEVDPVVASAEPTALDTCSEKSSTTGVDAAKVTPTELETEKDEDALSETVVSVSSPGDQGDDDQTDESLPYRWETFLEPWICSLGIPGAGILDLVAERTERKPILVRISPKKPQDHDKKNSYGFKNHSKQLSAARHQSVLSRNTVRLLAQDLSDEETYLSNCSFMDEYHSLTESGSGEESSWEHPAETRDEADDVASCASRDQDTFAPSIVPLFASINNRAPIEIENFPVECENGSRTETGDLLIRENDCDTHGEQLSRKDANRLYTLLKDIVHEKRVHRRVNRVACGKGEENPAANTRESLALGTIRKTASNELDEAEISKNDQSFLSPITELFGTIYKEVSGGCNNRTAPPTCTFSYSDDDDDATSHNDDILDYIADEFGAAASSRSESSDEELTHSTRDEPCSSDDDENSQLYDLMVGSSQ